jgi:hypothetical protein
MRSAGVKAPVHAVLCRPHLSHQSVEPVLVSSASLEEALPTPAAMCCWRGLSPASTRCILALLKKAHTPHLATYSREH